jgi:hypothetical protein
MSRTVHPFHAADISALAKLITRELEKAPEKPGHVQMLNILSRSVGYRNFQHFRASSTAQSRLVAPVPEPQNVDFRLVEAVLRCFDDSGVMLRWPSKTSHQRLSLWRLWAAFPAECDLLEAQVNAQLKALNGFGDHVLLRREMVNNKLLSRSTDCRLYRRIEQRPPPEALALLARAKTAALPA